jgi:hypothetical protein
MLYILSYRALPCKILQGERNQLLICGFTESRTNKKKLKYDVFYENFTRADVKAHLYLINFKFPAKHAGCHFSLRDRPFNLKGGVMVFCFVQIFFSDNTRVRIFYFFCRAKRDFFSRI